MKVSTTHLRCHLRSILEAVGRGESVLVTHRGKARAEIVPVASNEVTAKTENPFVGIWRDREDMRNVPAYVRRIRQGRIVK